MKIKKIKAPKDMVLVTIDYSDEDELVEGGVQKVRTGTVIDGEDLEAGAYVVFHENFEIVSLLSDEKKKTLAMHKTNLRAILELENGND